MAKEKQKLLDKISKNIQEISDQVGKMILKGKKGELPLKETSKAIKEAQKSVKESADELRKKGGKEEKQAADEAEFTSNVQADLAEEVKKQAEKAQKAPEYLKPVLKNFLSDPVKNLEEVGKKVKKIVVPEVKTPVSEKEEEARFGEAADKAKKKAKEEEATEIEKTYKSPLFPVLKRIVDIKEFELSSEKGPLSLKPQRGWGKSKAAENIAQWIGQTWKKSEEGRGPIDKALKKYKKEAEEANQESIVDLLNMTLKELEQYQEEKRSK